MADFPSGNSGNSNLHIPRPHRTHEAESTYIRQVPKIEVPDVEQAPMKYIALALLQLRRQLGNLAKMIRDESRTVDEYMPQTLTAESELTITLQPQWESTEQITSILVTGPVSTAFTLQLGDREWSLVTNVSGFVHLGPIKISLGRSDNRVLTANAPGNWSLELMGYVNENAQ